MHKHVHTHLATSQLTASKNSKRGMEQLALKGLFLLIKKIYFQVSLWIIP